MIALTESIDPTAAVTLLGEPSDFPDRRLHKRLCTLVAHLSVTLRQAPVRVARKWSRGAQRWFANSRLSSRALLRHFFSRAVTSVLDEPVLFVAHDTTEIDKHGRGAPGDAGPLRSSNSRGYLVHLAVACSLSGRLLGALDAWAWTRSWQLRQKDHNGRAMEDKESRKWDQGVDRIERALSQSGYKGLVAHSEDREADVFEHFVHQVRKRRFVVVRHDTSRARFVQAKRPHRDRRGHPTPHWISLESALRAEPWVETITVTVDSRMKDRIRGTTHQVRQATLSYRFRNVVLKRPKLYKGKHFREGLELGVVEVRECQPPAGVEPLHWVLMSTRVVRTREDARLVIDIYKRRWKAEDFIKLCKTGFQLESQHVDNLAGFKRLMAVVMATATQLAQLVTTAKEEPKTAAKDMLDAATLQAVKDTCSYHQVEWPRGRVTVAQLITKVAQVGGYELRRDRQPGWLVIQRGWARIEEHRAIVEHDRRRREHLSKTTTDSG